jgi:UMF1 family MFS transporter
LIPDISQKTKSSQWFTSKVFVWSLFDFANSSFATIIVAFVFAIYFKKVVASDMPIADFYWSSSINISMIIVAVLSPVLGATADYYGNKKAFLSFFTLLCIITTALMYFISGGMILPAMILFILSNIGFQAGLGFYDSFIKEITEEKNYNKVSSAGYAIGYLGSLAALAAVFVYKDEPRMSFIACAVLFSVFALPIFLFLKEKKVISGKNNENFLKIGWKRTADTLHNLRNFENLRKYLISYFLFIDGINTIIFFSAIFAQTTLKFSISELILFFVIVQTTAFIGSLIFGFIADIKGTKNTLLFTIICWTIITVTVFFCYSKILFLVIGGFAGFFLGSTQALARSLMGKLTPEEKKTEFFGFFSLFEKTSTILGPLVFGLVSWLSGDERYAILSIAAFFISGFFLLKKVMEPVIS